MSKVQEKKKIEEKGEDKKEKKNNLKKMHIRDGDDSILMIYVAVFQQVLLYLTRHFWKLVSFNSAISKPYR